MAKETFFFSHDYNSRNDPKLIKIMMKHGVSGIGIFWCIIEMMYEQAGFIMHSECERIAFELRVKCELVESVLNDFELFQCEDGKYWSISIQKRIEDRLLKSKKASESANKRWENLRNANALRTECEPNAIKERKGKENKGKKKKEEEKNLRAEALTLEDRKKAFYDSLVPFVSEFGKDMVRDFFNYWSEHNVNGFKMRFEMQKVFDIKKRLITWRQRQKNTTGGRAAQKPDKIKTAIEVGNEALDMFYKMNGHEPDTIHTDTGTF